MFSGLDHCGDCMPDVWICKPSKMAHSNCPWTDAIFYSQPIQTSGSFRSGLVVLIFPENMSKAVVKSLISCIKAEIHVISYQLPVDGHHIWSPTYTDVDIIPTSLSVLPGPENSYYGCELWSLTVTLAVPLYIKAHWASIVCGQLDWLRT